MRDGLYVISVSKQPDSSIQQFSATYVFIYLFITLSFMVVFDVSLMSSVSYDQVVLCFSFLVTVGLTILLLESITMLSNVWPVMG